MNSNFGPKDPKKKKSFVMVNNKKVYIDSQEDLMQLLKKTGHKPIKKKS